METDSAQSATPHPACHSVTGLAQLARGLILPLPEDAQARGSALANAAIAYLLAFLSLVVAHVPFVARAEPSGLPHAVVILWNDLLASHLGHLLLYGALLTLLGYAEGVLERKAEVSIAEQFFIAFKVVFWATLILGMGLHLCGARVDRWMLASQGILVLAGFVAIDSIRRRLPTLAGSMAEKNVVIVGTGTTACELAKQLSLARPCGRVLKGFVGRFSSGEPALLGSIDDLPSIARAEFIDEIIIACAEDRQLAERALTEALRSHLDVSVVPELFSQWPRRLHIHNVGPVPLIALHEEPIPRLGLFLKRIIDLVISTVALLLACPLMLVIGAAIKLESPGPVLYRALRTGKKGRSFECYKFRTMQADADRNKDALRCRNERQGPTFKIVNDPRITPLGRVLRRYSLDELPQLWNVLTGTMSIVGPRPHPLDDYQRYSLEDRRRLDVAPGITGLWQVTARADPSFTNNMALDLEYIENWSLSMDMLILLKTIPVVLAGTGA